MVAVDELRVWPTSVRCFAAGSCHLVGDTVTELHAFARRLGLRRAWFQNLSVPHYDLTPTKRAEAIRMGALEIPARVQAAWRVAVRRCTTPNGRTDGHGTYVHDGVRHVMTATAVYGTAAQPAMADVKMVRCNSSSGDQGKRGQRRTR